MDPRPIREAKALGPIRAFAWTGPLVVWTGVCSGNGRWPNGAGGNPSASQLVAETKSART